MLCKAPKLTLSPTTFNGMQVPACLLIVRNSTDTKYYQRLQPYPRVLLRRESCRFKDYEDLPIAWGVVIFCIAKHDVR